MNLDLNKQFKQFVDEDEIKTMRSMDCGEVFFVVGEL